MVKTDQSVSLSWLSRNSSIYCPNIRQKLEKMQRKMAVNMKDLRTNVSVKYRRKFVPP